MWTAQARRWQISMGGAEPPKFPKITPFCKGPPLPPYKNFPHGGGAMAPLAPPSATGLGLRHVREYLNSRFKLSTPFKAFIRAILINLTRGRAVRRARAAHEPPEVRRGVASSLRTKTCLDSEKRHRPIGLRYAIAFYLISLVHVRRELKPWVLSTVATWLQFHDAAAYCLLVSTYPKF